MLVFRCASVFWGCLQRVVSEHEFVAIGGGHSWDRLSVESLDGLVRIRLLSRLLRYFEDVEGGLMHPPATGIFCAYVCIKDLSTRIGKLGVWDMDSSEKWDRLQVSSLSVVLALGRHGARSGTAWGAGIGVFGVGGVWVEGGGVGGVGGGVVGGVAWVFYLRVGDVLIQQLQTRLPRMISRESSLMAVLH
ncbi:hypothetical protein Tco_0565449 [Tanacetum coccineum]